MFISPGDISALGGEARHAQPEPGGVLCTDEERQRTQVLLRRARGCETHHAELTKISLLGKSGAKHFAFGDSHLLFLVDGFKLLRN